MRCEDALNQLNARADGELREADAADLDAHLVACPHCKAAAEGFQAIDAELRRAFGTRREGAARLAERTVAMMRNSATEAQAPVAPISVMPQTGGAQRWAWGQTMFALAAGFLLAVAIFRPWKSPPDAPAGLPPLENVARLEVASGPVEVCQTNEIPAFTCPTGSAIARDSIVRTGPSSRCEISLKDGSAVRLDCNSEVTLHESDVLEVIRGRILTTSEPGRKRFEVQSGGGTFVAKEAAELAVDCQPQEVRLIVINGEVEVQTGQKSTKVGAGEQARIIEGKLVDNPFHCDAFLETSWVNSVLALRSHDDPELAQRVNQLLANVGAAKLSLLYEDELRRLGDDGVAPLLAYLASTRNTPNNAQRATAARIVADVAQARWIEDLIGLLGDENADVRLHAAHGLERLTGRNQGLEPRAWQSRPLSECAEPQRNWLQWWEANRARYPAASRSTPPLGLPPTLGSSGAGREGEAPAEP